MDGPVVGAIITAGVAVLVAVGTSVRTTVSAALDRRYERRRMFLLEAQDAMLVLREALDAYGAALADEVSGGAEERAAAVVLPAETSGAMTSSFAMGTTEATTLRVRTARARFEVARSRLEDDAVDAAFAEWSAAAQASLISASDYPATSEEAAFAHVNALISSALRTTRVRSRAPARRS